MAALRHSWSDSVLQRPFLFPQAYKAFNIFVCSGVKPSAAVTGQNVDDKSKRMFMERFHEMLTRKICATPRRLVENDQGNLKAWPPGIGASKLGIYKLPVLFYFCPVN